jgi:tetrahydrodipicolinate N-succinyltransferase
VTTDEHLVEENLQHRNAEILPGNVALSEEINENLEIVRQFNADNLVKREVEISDELPTVLEEQQEQLEQNQQRQSQPDIQNVNFILNFLNKVVFLFSMKIQF